ncbi:hypothetical protein GCM10010174_85150 [Kutzneria viridogrisea]|uniref:Uncharacterized protein n=1 Tax=Kutzneria albida DSM 43870 TaxID=1449976 RepID=W5VZL3_9PSEU|nr:hypothetical protein KALB_642 [Kutzneria albida DSM 43870]
MASVEQVRGQISLAKEQAERGARALADAETEIGHAQQAFQEAAQGSSQSEAGDVNNMFTAALQKIGEARDAVLAAMSNADSYAGRL